MSDKKRFWATVKPLFFNKTKPAEKIFLDESGEIIRNANGVKVANVFNRFFGNMVTSMGITNSHNFLSYTDNSDDPFENVIDKYKNHPSITCINKHMTNSKIAFTFQPVTKNQISNLIKLFKKQRSRLIHH